MIKRRCNILFLFSFFIFSRAIQTYLRCTHNIYVKYFVNRTRLSFHIFKAFWNQLHQCNEYYRACDDFCNTYVYTINSNDNFAFRVLCDLLSSTVSNRENKVDKLVTYWLFPRHEEELLCTCKKSKNLKLLYYICCVHKLIWCQIP